MNKTLKWIIAVVIVAIIIGIIVTQSNKQSASTESIKIGVSTILSSDWAALGENIVKTAKLAVVDVNANGGINGRPLELVIEDAGLDSKSGLSAAQKLINVDKIKYIIGGTSSNGTMAAAPVANEGHAVYLTPVTGGSNVDNAGEYIFRTANSDLLAGRQLAEAMIKLGYKKAVTVTEVTEYTFDIKKTFETTFKSLGGTVLLSEEFQPGTTDFKTAVAKVKGVQPEAILVLSQTGLGGAHFIKQAKVAGINAALFSDFTFVTNNDAKKIIGSFDGIYFTDPASAVDSVESKTFFDRYQKEYGSPSLIPFHSASTYDSVMMLTEALKAVGDDSVKVHDWLLKNVKNWKGLMGTYSLDEKGNSDLGFIVKVIRNGVAEEVKL
ncbi:MAG: ABC transporter substrate-binding protein [Patescibacteria group bacterium]